MAASGSEAGCDGCWSMPATPFTSTTLCATSHTFLVWTLTTELAMPRSEKESAALTIPGLASTPTHRGGQAAIMPQPGNGTVSVTGSRCVSRTSIPAHDHLDSVWS